MTDQSPAFDPCAVEEGDEVVFVFGQASALAECQIGNAASIPAIVRSHDARDGRSELWLTVMNRDRQPRYIGPVPHHLNAASNQDRWFGGLPELLALSGWSQS